MKIALFAGRNLLAHSFTRRLLASASPPVAIFRPTFAKPDQFAIRLRDQGFALPVAGATTTAPEPDQALNSLDAAGPMEIHAGALDAQVEQQLRQARPELIVSVCYPHKLPRALLNVAGNGGLNLHPSPLPAWRGNDPIFWQLRAGCSVIGLSWHRMTDVLDAGVVVARDCIELRQGMSAENLDFEIAQRGVALLMDILRLGDIEILRSHGSHCVPRGRYFSNPVEQDYRIFTSWSTDHVERFAKLLQSRGHRFHIHTATARITVRRLFDERRDVERDRIVVEVADGAVAFLK